MPELSKIDTTGLVPSLLGNSSSLTGVFGIGPNNTAITSDVSGNVSLNNGNFTVNSNTATMLSSLVQVNGALYPAGSAMTEWYNMYHCTGDTLDSAGWIHVRTPIPADAPAGVGWIPYMLEVKGYHTYDGEYSGRWGAIINTTGDGNNTFGGSRIKYNIGNYTPYVYRSNSTYGGYRRMCFSMQKVGCCCNGWLWIRINMNHQFRSDFAWGKIGTNSQTTAAF